MCKKQRHPHKLEAHGHILSLNKSFGIPEKWMRVYWCAECESYHIARKKEYRKRISILMNQFKAMFYGKRENKGTGD